MSGADRDRTCDPLNANQVLSQTELQPQYFVIQALNSLSVGLGRLELPTPALSERCSNRLSYKPFKI